ncbi:regulator of chromosome condensation domain-containing protein [Tieghemostelium lacteum]|uniref:Regulator of chromosome condensation domain-containing protein n=1 Tax=Tieghemostelium lacteum TaxID=361077 RepID=A0A151ZJY6_TIELA|nr:regulator of chromosome condensation domain-containing protein [Tieghemostelium lacteum]|eukprot:KYQ94237.1 regulator of chromosome condensation domain-containing protein [Tieghemostelium lacteum]
MDEEENERFVMVWGKTHNGIEEVEFQPKLLDDRLNDKKIQYVTSGFNHSFLMDCHGNAYSWGSNAFGQLSHGNKDHCNFPKNVQQLSLLKAMQNNEKLVQIVASKDYTIGLSDQGNLYGCGISTEGQLANGKDYLHQSPNSLHGLNGGNAGGSSNGGSGGNIIHILDSDSILSSSPTNSSTSSLTFTSQLTGYSQFQQTKQKDTLQQQQLEKSKKMMLLMKRIMSISNEIKIQKISCGNQHSLCLDKDGNVYSWGLTLYAGHYQADNCELRSSFPSSSSPSSTSPVHSNNSSPILSRSSTGKLSLSMSTSSASTSVNSQETEYIDIPKRISSLCMIIDIACGWSHSMVLDNKHNLLTWGIGKDGQLGNGSRSTVYRPSIINSNIQGQDNGIFAISCGAFHSAFISQKCRNLYSFGWKIPIGLGQNQDSLVPTLVESLSEYRLKSISCAYSHTLVLSETGECWSMGEGLYGQLGHGKSQGTSSLMKSQPTMIQPLSKDYFIEQISASRHQSLAIVKKRLSILQTSTNDELMKRYHLESAQDREDLNIDEIEKLINSSLLFVDDNEKLRQSIMGQEEDELSLMIQQLDDDLSEFVLLNNDGNLHSYQNGNKNLDTDYELLDVDELDDEHSEPIVIKKPFFDKYLKGSGNVPLSLNNNYQNVYNNNNFNNNATTTMHDLWTLKFIPKFDQLRLEKEWRSLWRKGFPNSVRPLMWRKAIGNRLLISDILCSELLEKIQRFKVYQQDPDKQEEIHQSAEYKHYLQTLNMIKVDLPRTFPTLKLFNPRGPYYEPLMNMLLMFALYRQDIGYVQGMSYLGAVIILVQDNEIDAFRCFANLLNCHYFVSLYKMDINGMVKHIRIFDFLFQSHLPRLYKKFKELNITPELYLIEWFMTLFTKQLPLPICLRLFDSIVMEGEVFIYAVCIGILKSLRKLIIDTTAFEDALDTLKTTIQDFKEERLFKLIESINIPKKLKNIITRINNEKC